MKIYGLLLFLSTLLLPIEVFSTLKVGTGRADLTPPIGTPSAGYSERKGEGMRGVHDPLLATALYIDNGEKQIILCSVDHLGLTYEIVQELTRRLHQLPGMAGCELFVSSSHTHSGGGGYLQLPPIGESLAGPYNEELVELLISGCLTAVVQASSTPLPAKIGIGRGTAPGLSRYRAAWPTQGPLFEEITLLKATSDADEPLALLFNFPLHPTILGAENREFSADFVGYARTALQAAFGEGFHAQYVNGAQGDIAPVILDEKERYNSCSATGKALAESAAEIWKETEARGTLKIETRKSSYAFKPQPTPFGLALPLESYASEMNLLIFNGVHAFLTVPGELSCHYEGRFRALAKELGYQSLTIMGLTNDAHGYILLPEAWRHKTRESALSFGGEWYGEELYKRGEALLKNEVYHP